MTWEKTLMKMPTEQSTELSVPEAGPYSLVTMASSVMQPLCLSLRVYTSPSARHPKQHPRVNHQPEKPNWKDSWAVPMVDWLPTRLPMMAPATKNVPAFPLPERKSEESFTRRPESRPTAKMSPTTRAIPANTPNDISCSLFTVYGYHSICHEKSNQKMPRIDLDTRQRHILIAFS